MKELKEDYIERILGLSGSIQLIIIFIEIIIFFTFGNAIKNDDFSIIAGFDSQN